jgi:anthranilate synthase/aminodeoxychorismate synthase-like glutamine amidotransferase
MIDNYDSFTYNLYQLLGVIGVETRVIRNDRITISSIRKWKPRRILISPGPGAPRAAGISKEVVKAFAPEIPILGVCLGHQCIAEVFSAKVKKTKKVVHGKTSLIYHNGESIFKNIKNPFLAARYHSLIVENVPDCLCVTAKTKDGVIMGIRHRTYRNTEGIQFHPESFMTEHGIKLLRNFICL